jgi:hypothetical protein
VGHPCFLFLFVQFIQFIENVKNLRAPLFCASFTNNELFGDGIFAGQAMFFEGFFVILGHGVFKIEGKILVFRK